MERLESIVLENLPELEKIEKCFARGCPNMRCFEMKACPALRSICKQFLADCPKLEKVSSLSHLNVLQSIGARFCSGTKVTSFSIVHCPQLVRIDEHFLSRNPALKTVVVEDAQRLAHLEAYFLAECPSLRSVVFRRVGDRPDVNPRGAFDGINSRENVMRIEEVAAQTEKRFNYLIRLSRAH